MKRTLIFATLTSMFLGGSNVAHAAPPFTPVQDLQKIEKNAEKEQKRMDEYKKLTQPKPKEPKPAEKQKTGQR